MYTVKEAANLLGINPHTVRYYTNQNLIPHLSRDKNGVRLFSDTDIEYLKVAVYLRNCGMSVQNIRKYFSLSEQGDSTIQKRYEMLLAQREQIDVQLRQISQSRDFIQHKLEYYAGFINVEGNGNKTEL